MKTISLTKGQFAIVDDEDFDFLNQQKWHYGYGGYACRKKYLGKTNNAYKYELIYMHRFINQTPVGLDTDHIDRNKLNNQRNNLRSVTSSANRINRGLRKDNKTGVTGVRLDKKNKAWVADLMIRGKYMYLGFNKDFQEAVKVRREAEEIYHAI